jgi:methyl-accepting chemotaxis protein
LRAGLAILGFTKLNGAIGDVENNTLPSVQLVNKISLAITQVRRTDMALLLCDDASCTARAAGNRDLALTKYTAAMEQYAPLISYPGEHELYDTFRQKFVEYQALSAQGREAAKAGKPDVARALLMASATANSITEAQAAADKDVELNAKYGREEGARTAHIGNMLLFTIISSGLMTLIMSLVTGIVLTRLIAPPLQTATAALERLAARDLTGTVESRGSDEIGRMSSALNSSVGAMRSVLRTVRQGAEKLAAAAMEMDLRSEDARGNAESQAGKTTQIAGAAQQMTATIGEISQNAESAASASRDSARTAAHGGEVMRAAATTMERIASATHTVSEKMDSLLASNDGKTASMFAGAGGLDSGVEGEEVGLFADFLDDVYDFANFDGAAGGPPPRRTHQICNGRNCRHHPQYSGRNSPDRRSHVQQLRSR